MLRQLLLAWSMVAMLGPAAAAGPPSKAGTRGVVGTVSQVVDGDTLWFTPAAGGAPLKVRLLDIDAPESCQDGGSEARAFLAEQVLDRPVQLQIPKGRAARDEYGRTLAWLVVGDIDMNRRLVEEGHAWSARVKWDRGPYVPQERMARALRRGLHKAGDAAVMPRDFRRSHGPCVGPGSTGAVPPAPAPAAPAQVARCDGRTRCTQMTSCDEARYFLKHCPGVQLDGDGDGIPCELQWCRN